MGIQGTWEYVGVLMMRQRMDGGTSPLPSRVRHVAEGPGVDYRLAPPPAETRARKITMT